MFYLKVCNYILEEITGPRSDLHDVLNVMAEKMLLNSFNR